MKLHQLIVEDAIAHSLIPILLKKGAIVRWRAFDKEHVIRSIEPMPNSRGQYRVSVGSTPWEDAFVPDEYLEHARLEKIGDNEWRLLPDFTYRMSAQAANDRDRAGRDHSNIVHDWESQ